MVWNVPLHWNAGYHVALIGEFGDQLDVMGDISCQERPLRIARDQQPSFEGYPPERK